jgi:hypothetical protein
VKQDQGTSQSSAPTPKPVKQISTGQLRIQLRDRIAAACPEAADVDVAFTSGMGLFIRLAVSDGVDKERLTARVQALPELSPFLMQVEIIARQAAIK